jgi:hypothetical protein
MSKLCLAQEPEADALLEDDPFALPVGMLPHQQVRRVPAEVHHQTAADGIGAVEALSSVAIRPRVARDVD